MTRFSGRSGDSQNCNGFAQRSRTIKRWFMSVKRESGRFYGLFQMGGSAGCQSETDFLRYSHLQGVALRPQQVLPDGVMATHLVLVQAFKVRVLVGQLSFKASCNQCGRLFSCAKRFPGNHFGPVLGLHWNLLDLLLTGGQQYDCSLFADSLR